MLKKVLFFSCEPGGAEVIAPLAKLLTEVGGYDVTVTGYGFAIERFEQHRLSYTLVDEVKKNDIAFLKRFSPDLVITSATSIPAKDMSEKYLWHLARKLSIKSIAILDQWQNYSIRFSGTTSQDRLAYLPDAINCIDEIGRKEMIAEGFDANLLYPLGQPYLDSLEFVASTIDCVLIKEKLNVAQYENIVLFVSEAIEENYGNERGYTQYDALQIFLENTVSSQNTLILIKLHPKDSLEKFQKIRNEFTWHKLMFISNEITALEAITISNRVFGMTSIMLIEAYILGKLVVSIQPNLKITDPLILSRCGYVQSLVDERFKIDLTTTVIPMNGNQLKYELNTVGFLSLVDKFIQFSSRSGL